MTFNVDNWRSQIGQILRPNLFQVQVLGPASLGDKNSTPLRLYATRTAIPGFSAQTMEDNIEAGVTRLIAHSTMSHNQNVEFLLTEDLSVHNYFENWYHKVLGMPYTKDFVATDFSPNFYNEYTGEVVIDQFSKTGKKIMRTTLVEAYPVTIGEIALGWDNNNQASYINVEFAYLYHTTKYF